MGSTWHAALMPTPGAWAYDWQPGGIGTATIRTRAIDDSGNLESASLGTTVNVVAGDCPCTSLWKPSSAPLVPSAADPNPVELGVKFTSDIAGFITGIRFYKGPANNSTHVGNLWTSTGTLLGDRDVRGRDGHRLAAGAVRERRWRSPPTRPTSASYHTNVGGYAADGGYFGTSGVDSPPLHAPASAVSGGNGVFAYGATHVPDADLQRHQLLGGRGLRAEPRPTATPPVITSDQVDDRRQLARDDHLDDQRGRDLEDPVLDRSGAADEHLVAAAGDDHGQPVGVRDAAQRAR